MDSILFDQLTDFDGQDNIFLDLVKQHIASGLNVPLTGNYVDLCQTTKIPGEQELDENESLPAPVVYKKRARIKFTEEQLDVLEATFEQHRYPTIDMIDDLVEQLNLPTQKITVWFQNRRARLKKCQDKVVEKHHLVDRDEQKQRQTHYDSGIHLDEDSSRASSTSPPSYNYSTSSYCQTGPSSSGYFFPQTMTNQETFYNRMWNHFHYPLSVNPLPSTSPYTLTNYSSPFCFQETNVHPSSMTPFYG